MAAFLISKPSLSSAGKVYVKFPMQKAPTKLDMSPMLGTAVAMTYAIAQYTWTTKTHMILPRLDV